MNNKEHMCKFEPIPTGIIVELVEVEETSSGIILPDGRKASDLDDYKGEIILKVGSDVQRFKEGDRVYFFPYAQPSLIKDMDTNGKVITYMFFRESDIMAKVI
jgi:co-chaperonin GroES (HSP10)